MTDIKHPFVVGAEVYIRVDGGWNTGRLHHWKTGKVAKVHKTGRFVLEGDPQQYRAIQEGNSYDKDRPDKWSGGKTGEYGSSVHLAKDIGIEKFEADNRRRRQQIRFGEIQTILDKVKFADVTDEMMTHLDAAVAYLPKKETT